MGFAQGVSGLNASASNLDVIGNNIANSGTIGFKSGSVQFSDVYAGSRVGLGAEVAGVSQNFSSGAVQTSSRALDVAITNGDGLFRLASPSGEIVYSRNGQFNMDKSGFIVNAGGYRLTGYPVGANGATAGASPTPLQLPTSAMAPKSTEKVAAQFNLDSRSVTPTAVFDATNSNSYNYANAVTVFDSLGNSHELATFFVKAKADAAASPAVAENTWNVFGAADGTVVNGGASISTLTFDDRGAMNPPNQQMTVAGLDFANGSSTMDVTVDVTGTTQFGNANEVNKLTQDGYTSGVLSSFSIEQNGTITGKYSNEQTQSLGKVVLSSFMNPNGLKSLGGNLWTETAASGGPLTGSPGDGTKLGALTSGAVEASNVDLTAELVNLIIAQRTYQANAQTVKTQDQVLQTLVNLR
ncbi:Flagellar hook protein FlgE [Polaromonas sp. CG9_12]|nr:Flagellar hook protein FlgE [Polaromonas sp. CG9_12]